jgi:hypothetical protein
MRVNAAKVITRNQPLIADCRPLILGRQEADLDLVPRQVPAGSGA